MAASDRSVGSRRTLPRILVPAVLLAASCPPPLDRPPPGGPDLRPDRSVRDRSSNDLPASDRSLLDRGPDLKTCGSAAECDDQLACTTDACTSGVCSHPLQAGSCLIDGACVSAGTASAQDPCLTCDPARSTSAWSKQICVSTLAGTSIGKYLDGPVASACFHAPSGVAVNAAGDLVIVADSSNLRIRQIAAGQVSTLAGSGLYGTADGPAATATFGQPNAVAFDAAANRVFVADTPYHRIRLIEAGQVSTYAGTGVPETPTGLRSPPPSIPRPASGSAPRSSMSRTARTIGSAPSASRARRSPPSRGAASGSRTAPRSTPSSGIPTA